MTNQTDPTPVVKVTLNDIYATVQRVEKKVDAMEGQKEDIADHEERIRSLEKWIWRASGLAALGGAGLGQALTKLLGGN